MPIKYSSKNSARSPSQKASNSSYFKIMDIINNRAKMFDQKMSKGVKRIKCIQYANLRKINHAKLFRQPFLQFKEYKQVMFSKFKIPRGHPPKSKMIKAKIQIAIDFRAVIQREYLRLNLRYKSVR